MLYRYDNRKYSPPYTPIAAALTHFLIDFLLLQLCSHVFVAEAIAAHRGKLASQVHILTTLQVVDDAIVAVLTAFSPNQRSKTGVLVLKFSGTGNLNHTFEIQFTPIPTQLHHRELRGTHFLACSGFIDLKSLFFSMTLKLLKCLSCRLNHDEVNTRTDFITLGIRYFAFHISAYLIRHVISDLYFGNGSQKLNYFLEAGSYSVVVKISNVYIHCLVRNVGLQALN